ncbi:MAG: hypothetical protein ABR988_02195 [Terriglobales bacterium]|jgi:hypothetical protein
MSDAFHGDVLAEETHTGRVWILLMVPALIGPAISLSRPHGRTSVVVSAATLVVLMALGVSAMAWSGFQYRFLRHGVEIRMLGFRLRSIPKQSIVSYSIEPWAFIRGYGIRGIGSTRAYVGATPLYTSGLRPARFSWGTAIRSGSSGTWIW